MISHSRRIGLSLALTFALVVGAIYLLPEGSEAAAVYTHHEVIRIQSDDDLIVGLNGIVSGSGSSSDPFVISGWQIGMLNASSGIEIWNTREHIRIADVDVSYCNIGILLFNVSGVSVRDSILYGNILGVSIQYSDSVKVAGCTFENNTFGMTITYSDVSRSGNTYIDNGQNVIEKKHPWEQGPLGTLVCVIILIPLVIVVSLAVFLRIKHRQRPPPIVQ